MCTLLDLYADFSQISCYSRLTVFASSWCTHFWWGGHISRNVTESSFSAVWNFNRCFKKWMMKKSQGCYRSRGYGSYWKNFKLGILWLMPFVMWFANSVCLMRFSYSFMLCCSVLLQFAADILIFIFSSEILMGALGRTLREDWKKSFELATNIVTFFLNLSLYSSFHSTLARYKVSQKNDSILLRLLNSTVKNNRASYKKNSTLRNAIYKFWFFRFSFFFFSCFWEL